MSLADVDSNMTLEIYAKWTILFQTLKEKCPCVFCKDNDQFLTNIKCTLEPFVKRELLQVELALYNSWAPIDIGASEVIKALGIN